jgi:hypothetical protein
MSLLINIAAQFSGKKALKDAQKQVNVLESSVKKLGTTLGVSLSAAAVVAFGKASVRAFAEDEKAATRLAGVLDNLGLSFANLQVQGFIEDLSKASGVVDDELRPAFQALLTTTGSLANSQKLLAQAIDVSAGSGVELTTVANDLAQAYVGNTRGLRKYNLGLTQAELKVAKFADIQARLTTLFSGSNAKYLDTYAGKMQLLTTAAGEAQETIGAGLVDALTIIAGKDGDIQNLADSMADVATQINNVTRGLGMMIAEFKKIPGAGLLGDAFSAAVKTSGLGALINLAAKKGATKQSTGFSFFGSPMETTQNARNAAAAAKAEAAAKKRSQELVKATKTNTAELKKQVLAKKQSALFDLEQIQIIAALKGKISAEDKLRLELQLALITGNEDQAAKLSKQLANSIDSTGKLATYLTTLPEANNPFKAWDSWLMGFKANLAGISGVTVPAITGISNVPATNIPAGGISASVSTPSGSVAANSNPIQVYVNGSVISENDLVAAIEAGLQKSSLSGSPSSIGRVLGMFG